MTEKEFLNELKKELVEQNASLWEFSLISSEMIENAINNGRTPKDVAWALLQ